MDAAGLGQDLELYPIPYVRSRLKSDPQLSFLGQWDQLSWRKWSIHDLVCVTELKLVGTDPDETMEKVAQYR